MSEQMFLPQGFGAPTKDIKVSGVDALAPLTPEEIELQRRLFGSVATLPDVFKSWISEWQAVNTLPIARSQVQGLPLVFDQVEAQRVQVFADSVATFQTTTSGAFTDLATSGPTVSDLPDGLYLVLWGAFMGNNGGVDGWVARMGISVNGAAVANEVTNGQNAGAFYEGGLSLSGATTKTLSSGLNTIESKYALSNGGTAGFSGRFLTAIKIGS